MVEMICQRCKHEWNYSGKKTVIAGQYPQYTNCPRCMTNVKIKIIPLPEENAKEYKKPSIIFKKGIIPFIPNFNFENKIKEEMKEMKKDIEMLKKKGKKEGEQT